MLYPICIKFVWRQLEFAFLCADFSRRTFLFLIKYKFAKKTLSLKNTKGEITMEHYTLQKDEVILYHGTVILLPNDKKPKASQLKKTENELILTNFNFVFINKTKRLLGKDVEVEIYKTNEVKFYKDNPYMIRKKNKLEIYFTATEKFVEFSSEKEAKNFINTAMRLVSGKSKFVRTVKKVQNEIQETNKELDIDIVKIAGKAAQVAAEVAIEASGVKTASKTTKFFGIIAKTITNKKDKAPTPLLTESEETE